MFDQGSYPGVVTTSTPFPIQQPLPPPHPTTSSQAPHVPALQLMYFHPLLGLFSKLSHIRFSQMLQINLQEGERLFHMTSNLNLTIN